MSIASAGNQDGPVVARCGYLFDHAVMSENDRAMSDLLDELIEEAERLLANPDIPETYKTEMRQRIASYKEVQALQAHRLS